MAGLCIICIFKVRTTSHDMYFQYFVVAQLFLVRLFTRSLRGLKHSSRSLFALYKSYNLLEFHGEES